MIRRICPILFLCLMFSTSYSQHLANDVVGVSGEEISNAEINLNTTVGELVTSTISNSEITLTQGFQQTAQIVYISPVAILQGASIGTSDGLMRDNLRTANYIPTTSPNNPLIKESNNAFAITGNDAVVDWVTVKLRNADNKIITEKSALMQRDGNIVSADGVSPLQFTTQNNDYKVEINHRNHLGILTQNPISLSSTPALIDFTNNALTTFGSNARVQLTSGAWALWAGDANNNENVKFSGASNDSNIIKSLVLNDPGNFFNFLT